MNLLGETDDLTLAAFDSGQTCAVAAQGQRDLQGCVSAYPGLFPVPPFDCGVFATLAMANAFSAPWLAADGLRIANRTSLWAFRVDWFFDHVATSRTELLDVVARCLAVAEGGGDRDDDQLGRFLAAIRAELARTPDFAELAPAWVTELRRMLTAMVREWDWKAGAGGPARPGIEEYLGNADNLGSSFVDLSHWIANPEPAGSGTPRTRTSDLDATLTATRAAQRAIRVINDLASVARDERSGDLNLLLLGSSQADAVELATTLTAAGRTALAPLASTQPRLALFVRRQVDFCLGFYGRTDYWGDV